MAPRINTEQTNVPNETIVGFAMEIQREQRTENEHADLKRAAAGRKRAIYKRAKAAGLDNVALSTALAIKLQDPEEVAISLRNTIHYVSVVAPAVKLVQSDLFRSLSAPPLGPKVRAKVEEFEAESRGYAHGLSGGQLADGPVKGNAGHAAFGRGYIRGQTVIAERMGENSKQADAGLTKRRGKMAAAADDDEDDDKGNVLPFDEASGTMGQA